MSVTAARGFRATGVHAGVKPDGRLDTALVTADRPVAAAAVFTTSLTAAPVVTLARKHLVNSLLQALVINSGCANAGTGEAGLVWAEQIAGAAARALGCHTEDVLVASTGPIGTDLPVEEIVASLPAAVSRLEATADAATLAARSIMTTDSVPKEATVAGDGYVIGGMSKGAGMIRPDMATMLAYVTTDAVVNPATLQAALSDAVDVTFNCLNIDGCQSTNDMVVLLASGDSGTEPDPAAFASHLTRLCRDLTWQMAKDAEGASRVVTLHISGADDHATARVVGKAVADSALVRSSFYGGDPNWGRILQALGVTGVPLHQEDIEIAYEGTTVTQGGVGIPHDEADLMARLEQGDFEVSIVVGMGHGRATVVTTDLTPEYVVFNGERS